MTREEQAAFRLALRNSLNDNFNLNELKVLCDDIDVNWEDLSGDNLKIKALELIGYCERRSMLPKLVKAMLVARLDNAEIRTLAVKIGVPMDEVTAASARDTSSSTDDTLSNASSNEDRHVGSSVHKSATEEPLGAITKRWALIVGINKFKPGYNTLLYCEADAKGMGERLAQLGFDCTMMTASNAHIGLEPDKFNILAQLKRICNNAERNDLILLHFSTHGVRSKDTNKPWLIAEDTQPEYFEQTALSVDDMITMLRASKSRRHVLLLDACHMGVDKSTNDIQEQALFRKYVHDRAQGMTLLAASTASQTAKERDGNGLFTRFVLDGLSGAADRGRKGYITTGDLEDHVLWKVRQWYDDNHQARQDPTHRLEGIGEVIVAELSTNQHALPSQDSAPATPATSARPGEDRAQSSEVSSVSELDPARWDSERLRRLLLTYDDSKVRDLTFDNFRDVYNEKFATNTPKGEKIQALIEHCTTTNTVGLLLRKLKSKDEARFNAFIEANR